MEIISAEVMGFCFGVRRAIELAESALERDSAVYTLGPLVHNPQEIARLTKLGIKLVENAESISGPTVIIRAHGARPELLQQLRQRNLHIADATCPFVTNSQRIAQKLAENGQQLIIVGHADHPEVQGILGYVNDEAYIITDPKQVADLPDDIHPGIIAQTTINEETFTRVVDAILARFPTAIVHDTVCSATRERQEAAKKLAAMVDAMLIIGGRQSSNTNRLAEICAAVCPQSYLIETAEEIDPAWLQKVKRVGITAGASTPNWLIEEVKERLEVLASDLPTKK